MNPFDKGFFNETELREFGFKSVGKNVKIEKTCTIVGLHNISIGDDVVIDGFTTIIAAGSGFVNIGSNVHIAGYCHISAGAGVTFSDFSGISQGVRIYTKTDDYTGKFLTNPTVDMQYKGVQSGEVKLGRHVIIGSGSVIMPGVIMGDGVAVGALSMVTKSLPEWGVYFGSPVKKIKNRSKKLLTLEKEYLNGK